MHSPANFTPAQAASFAFSYYTGYFALLEIARLQPYQTVLITAASSTTGLAAIATAKKIGATIIARTRTSKKRALLLEAGVHLVIATEEEDLVARVMDITGGQRKGWRRSSPFSRNSQLASTVNGITRLTS